jgi:HEAT repeat protein
MAVPDNSTEGLIEQLTGADDWQIRRQAALRLARCERDTEVLIALTTALDDRDPDVRHAAVVALGELGDPQAVEVLCRPKLVEDPSARIRWATVTAIGRLGDLSAANVLSRALEDPDWVVHNQALLAISDFIRRIPDTVDGDQVKRLIRLLSIRDSEVRSLVIDALARRSTRGLDEMVEAMQLKSRVVRAGVAEALGLSRDPRAVAPLIEATADPVSAVRREAARGLGRLGHTSAVEPLIVMLGDSDRAAAGAAVEALVSFADAAVDPLCAALGRAVSKLHRRNLILALGGIRSSRAIIPLLNSLSSTYYVVRQAAITALSGYGEEVIDDLVDMVHVSRVPIDDLLDDALGQANKRLRLRAIRALGELKNAAAIKPMRGLMQDPDSDIVDTVQLSMSKIGLAAWARYGAVIALGNIGHPKATSALIRALGDHSEYVRLEAARGLAKLADTAAIAPLIDTLEGDEDAGVRREAACALRAVGEQSAVVAHAFRQALADGSWKVRVEAARALGRIDDDASVEPLLATLEDDSYTVMTSAEHALANLGELALPQLLEVAGGPVSPRLAPALRALAEYLGEERGAGIEALADKARSERRAELEKIARST